MSDNIVVPGDKRIAHDFAWAAAYELINCLRPVLREEDVVDLFKEIYSKVKEAMEAALTAQSRQMQRLRPC
jgi:hypothetical protein